MDRRFKLALLQTNSGRDIEPNVKAVLAMMRDAKAKGAHFVTMPEVVQMIEPKRDQARAKVTTEEASSALAAFRAAAAELGLWVLVGSLQIKLAEERMANRSFLLDPAGHIVARYDKIHMFDVDLGDGQRYRESAAYQAGERAVMAELPWGRLGLTVCYDLRFPQLYRALAQAGAEFLTVPSAFTRVTGEAHWHVLLRARAIETGCFVVAPAQTGVHAEGRETFGHSLVVGPWGDILADAGTETGVTVVDIDPAHVAEARRKVPSLTHDRPFAPAELVNPAFRAAGE
ncbi:MAG: carbon-nitrogen hydrolase family protein [Proteobacteria bacterium]|nr:carbon-nitrogen hydrolase family protein [Pseudomonadota bacterium]MBI3499473.1 carbon-nitrogen hydrolase family protein [Pseudomonadota bacterium]